MKKLLTLAFSFAAATVALAQVSVNNNGVVVSGPESAEYNPTVSKLGGGVTEYKDLRPELSISLLSVSAAVGYESQYMFRGEKFAGHSIQPKVEFAYPLYGFDIYVGAWANTPVQGSKGGLTEIDLYGGVNYYYKSLRVDLGYILYYYPDVDETKNNLSRDMEVYIGAAFDTSSYLGGININPSVYYFYNWVLDQHVVEVSFGYNTPVGEYFIDEPRLTLPVNVYGGYLSSGKKNGDNGMPDEGVTYWYMGASCDVAFAITEYCTISAGVRYSIRNGGNEGVPVDHYELLGRENNIWFGGKVDFGF